jgi:hypothetical protein
VKPIPIFLNVDKARFEKKLGKVAKAGTGAKKSKR